ncbi:MAG: hypothetical protein J7L47_03910 [Candidatus Odinarchaeota archaeon]|nr:hypothetical protein [Candidatus Odinarchaeota archaeon]
MNEITTISISRETKKFLEQKKGKDKTWDEFFREIILEKEKLEALLAATRLEKEFTQEIEEAVTDSTNELRRSLRFKEVEL